MCICAFARHEQGLSSSDLVFVPSGPSVIALRRELIARDGTDSISINNHVHNEEEPTNTSVELSRSSAQ
jgi:hypothetical protein